MLSPALLTTVTLLFFLNSPFVFLLLPSSYSIILVVGVGVVGVVGGVEQIQYSH
jgi:hypothetical protein